jgi:outer membrane lipoprotein SlyB
MKSLSIALALAAALLAGCATYEPGPADGGERRMPQQQGERKEYPGVVESVREVQVDTERTGAAPLVGAVIGGTVGSSVGHGRGSSAGAAVGTVIGGIVGEAAAQAATQPGLEITVRLDAGGSVAVMQPVTEESFRPGDRVRVIADGRTARVTK